MSTPTDIGTLIARSPEIRGGRPRIAGTGVTVRQIVASHRLGLSVEEIADHIGHIYAALAYYHANHEEIDADLAEEDAFTRELERQHGITPGVPG